MYVLQGISPTSGIEYKSKPKGVDKIYGNGFVYHLVQTQREGIVTSEHFLLHRILQIDPPTRKESPDCKIFPLVKLLNHVAKEAWQLGLSF